jgi:predicted enzyme related to lactoylglutathione lyase
MTTYANGTPSWVDLGSPDADASVAFYGGLFGWTATNRDRSRRPRLPDAAEGGKNVAGLGPAMEGQPNVWTTYLASTTRTRRRSW